MGERSLFFNLISFMQNAIAIGAVLGPVYMIVGLSFLLHMKSWQKLLEKWDRDHFDLFPLMLMYVVAGTLILKTYNSWEWNVWLIVTIAGWGCLIKGLFYFLAPGPWVKTILKIKNNTGLLYFAGVVAVILGVILSYNVYAV